MDFQQALDVPLRGGKMPGQGAQLGCANALFFQTIQGERIGPRTRRDAEIFAFERSITESLTLSALAGR